MLRTIIIALCFITLVCCTGGKQAEYMLFDFESEAELDRLYWSCHTLMSVSDEHATHGEKSLKLALFPSAYPGFAPKLNINDWRRYRAVHFDIYNPSVKEKLIVVRIDDNVKYPDYMDRYNQRIILKPGPIRISIPLDSIITTGTRRIMDLGRIQRFLIFMVHPVEKCDFYIDYVRLSHKISA